MADGLLRSTRRTPWRSWARAALAALVVIVGAAPAIAAPHVAPAPSVLARPPATIHSAPAARAFAPPPGHAAAPVHTAAPENVEAKPAPLRTAPLAYVNFKVAPKLPTPKDERRATVLTYLMTDDTAHQSPHSQVMLDMMKAETPVGIHSIVFRDGKENGDSRLYYMRAKNDWRAPEGPGATESLLAPGLTEVQSNHPKVLEQIVQFAFDNYQSKRRYLEIYTHGGGVLGIGTDSYKTDLDGNRINGGRIISPADFGGALRTALKGRTLDAIYFRSCLMGNVEALYELRGTAKYAIASQLASYSTENSNITMTKMFQEMAAEDKAPEEIAKRMAIQAYAKSFQTPDGKRSGYKSIVAADLGKVDELKSALNVLVRNLKAVMPAERAAIIAAYDASDTMNKLTMGDLWRFTRELQERVQDPGVQAAVARVRSAQRGVMIHAKDSGGNDIGGLSIFMPRRAQVQTLMERTKYRTSRFARDTGWIDFLESIAEPEAQGAPVLQVERDLD